ncbi:hypothetical protein EJ07DRAFT_151841 [Lizonia empirigonia]|nr:hypothetical protein EJ07DRAFT_151841 [Lizonia empirigonia]
MKSNTIPSFLNKRCSNCRNSAPEEGFFRRGKVWKTCNECANKASNRRKAEYDNLRQRMEGLSIEQRQVPPMPEHIHLGRRQLQQQFGLQEQLPDQRMTVEYLLNDPDPYEPTPLELHEQRRRRISHTQQFFESESLQVPPEQQLLHHQDLEPELFAQPSPSVPVHPSLETLPQYEMLDPNIYSHFGIDGEENLHSSWSDIPGLDDQELDFDECLANALQGDMQRGQGYGQPSLEFEYADNGILQADSLFPMDLMNDRQVRYEPLPNGFDATMDVNMANFDQAAAQENGPQITAGDVQALCEASFLSGNQIPDREPHPELAPYSLHHIFTDFNASEDILRQPATPIHAQDLTGEALAKHLISEFGLAVRLSEMYRRWRLMKQAKFLKEVNVLVSLEAKDTITPWGPLSDWLTLYETELEEILDQYGENKTLDWKMKRELQLCKKRLERKIKTALRLSALELIDQNTDALLKLFLEGSKHPERKVKTELKRQLRIVQTEIARDCADNGVLRLKMGPVGAYVQS